MNMGDYKELESRITVLVARMRELRIAEDYTSDDDDSNYWLGCRDVLSIIIEGYSKSFFETLSDREAIVTERLVYRLESELESKESELRNIHSEVNSLKARLSTISPQE